MMVDFKACIEPSRKFITKPLGKKICYKEVYEQTYEIVV